MNRRIFWLVAFMLTGFAMHAQKVMMQLTNETIQEFTTSSVDQMNFQNNHFQFKFTDGTSQTINFSMISRIYFDESFSVSELNDEAPALSLFPNPAGEFITLQQTEQLSGLLEVFSMSGHLVKSFWMEGESLQLNLSDFESGVYFVRYQHTNLKFIKL